MMRLNHTKKERRQGSLVNSIGKNVLLKGDGQMYERTMRSFISNFISNYFLTE